jgi:hypothetical protein
LYAVQEYFHAAGRTFHDADRIAIGEPIASVAVRLVTEAIEAREELAVENGTQLPGQLPPT